MPEANVLFAVTGVVVVGLVAWVAIVVRGAKEPWSRPRAAVALASDGGASDPATDLPAVDASTATASTGSEDANADADAKSDADANADADAKS